MLAGGSGEFYLSFLTFFATFALLKLGMPSAFQGRNELNIC